jgi:hypothetical protein
MKRAILLIFLSFAAASCGRGRILPGEAKCDADPCGCNECPTAVDASLRDAFKCRLVPITDAGDVELCRRLYVDTVGRLPTPEDYAADCQGKNVDTIVDTVMGKDEYVVSRQKLWADRFGYNDLRSWYLYTLELDVTVSKLYRGEIDLPTFVQQASIHPALLTAGDDLLASLVDRSANPRIDPRTLKKTPTDGFVEAAFEALLLRSPSAEEMSEVANLYRQYEIDPAANDPSLPGFSARQIFVQPCNCVGAKKASCQTSNNVGAPQDVSVALRTPNTQNCEADNGFLITQGQPQELASLNAPGKVIAGRPDFFENHVRDTLVRLLGYDPIATLDEATGAALLKSLATNLKSDGSLRNLERAIFRSILYRQAQQPASPALDCAGNDSPIFAGPRKRLDADAYFASISTLTGYSLGKCDYRFQTRTYPKLINGVNQVAYAPPASIYSYDAKQPATGTEEPDLAGRNKARTLGACGDRVEIRKQDDAGPFFLMALDYVTREACDTAPIANLGSGGADETALASVTDTQWKRFFLSEPSAEEKAASVAAMQACLQTPATCPADRVSRRFCSALLKSARFATY